MFTANVYRIMIGCPGDVQEEVQTAKEVINRWTSLHAEQNGTVLIPINWETHSYPEHGAHPQKILDSQLAGKSDMLVAIFGAKVGTPTDTSLSGTIEEIEEHIKAGKPVMLFFRKYNDLTKTSSEELAKLESFKSSIKSQGLYREYDTEKDFEKAFSDALTLFLTDHWLKESIPTNSKETSVKFTEEELEVLKSWTASNSPEAHSIRYMDGTSYIIGDLQFDVQDARSLVKWKDFFNRLEGIGFIELNRYTRSGDPVYQLCVPAYEYIDSLDKR